MLAVVAHQLASNPMFTGHSVSNCLLRSILPHKRCKIMLRGGRGPRHAKHRYNSAIFRSNGGVDRARGTGLEGPSMRPLRLCAQATS